MFLASTDTIATPGSGRSWQLSHVQANQGERLVTNMRGGGLRLTGELEATPLGGFALAASDLRGPPEKDRDCAKGGYSGSADYSSGVHLWHEHDDPAVGSNDQADP